MIRVVYLALGILLGAAAAHAFWAEPPFDQDAVKVSPGLYTVKVENDRVRVLEYALKPGQIEPMHSHGAFVVRFLSDAKIRATSAQGQPSESSVARGDSAWRDPTTHSIQNIGTTDLTAFIVDVKPCQNK